MPDRERYIICRIKGKVQGVGYRAWTQQHATRLGVCGWVKNEADGSVLSCFAGTEKNVRTLIEQCRKGPPTSSVTAVTEYPATASDAGSDGDFIINH